MLINQPINLLHIHFTFPVHESDRQWANARHGRPVGMVEREAKWKMCNNTCSNIDTRVRNLGGSITLGPHGGNDVRFTRRNKNRNTRTKNERKMPIRRDQKKKLTGPTMPVHAWIARRKWKVKFPVSRECNKWKKHRPYAPVHAFFPLWTSVPECLRFDRIGERHLRRIFHHIVVFITIGRLLVADACVNRIPSQ